MVKLKNFKIISHILLFLNCFFNTIWVASIVCLPISDIALCFIVKSPLVLLLSMSDMPKVVWLICAFMVLLSWISIFVLSILGIFIKKVRIPLYALSILAALYDVIFSFIFSSVEMKISALFMFAIVFLINMLFITVQVVLFVLAETGDGGLS